MKKLLRNRILDILLIEGIEWSLAKILIREVIKYYNFEVIDYDDKPEDFDSLDELKGKYDLDLIGAWCFGYLEEIIIR